MGFKFSSPLKYGTKKKEQNAMKKIMNTKMKLSNQAMGAIMMALQKALLEQSDIVPVLKSFEFKKSPDTKRWGTTNGELIVQNPPSFNLPNDKGSSTPPQENA